MRSGGSRDQFLRSITDRNQPFHDRDMYVFALDSVGTYLAFGGNSAKGGDPRCRTFPGIAGEQLVQDIIAQAERGPGWVEYDINNPATGKVQTKMSFVRKAGRSVCGLRGIQDAGCARLRHGSRGAASACAARARLANAAAMAACLSAAGDDGGVSPAGAGGGLRSSQTGLSSQRFAGKAFLALMVAFLCPGAPVLATRHPSPWRTRWR